MLPYQPCILSKYNMQRKDSWKANNHIFNDMIGEFPNTEARKDEQPVCTF